ncbi:MAG: sigma-70 family RNA polymerase sigma factor, partial [Planctomycetes bacterium]|nr:sigma-70 family RNA polymerase sigma factor [Planctomycetota bacterium]
TQDLIQTAAREAFRKLPALKDDAKFFAWFERIIARKIASYRRRVRREEAAIAKKLEDKDGKSTTAEPAFVTEEEHRKLKRLIRDLSEPYPREMRVIELVYFKKLEFKAIGKKLDISERNLFRLRDKGLELLRKRMYPK